MISGCLKNKYNLSVSQIRTNVKCDVYEMSDLLSNRSVLFQEVNCSVGNDRSGPTE